MAKFGRSPDTPPEDCRMRATNLAEEFWAMAFATDDTIVGDDTAVVRSPAQAGWTGGWNGVSWSAVIAGAFTAIAVSIIVIALGTGIGMEVVSPYSSSPSAGTMTIIGALWLVFAQAVGFAVGGYVAGRLRRPPATMHAGEVKFRDGANGLVVWAIGVVVGSLILAAAVNKAGSAAGAAAAGTTAFGVVGAAAQAPSMDYFTDMLLRPTPQGMTNQAMANNGAAAGAGNATATDRSPTGGSAANGNSNIDSQERGQVYRIMLTSLGPNGLSNDDRTYLAQIVAARTGISQEDAQNRVNSVLDQAKEDATQATDAARKAAAYVSFWTFMSLLFGAVCATLGGVLGGDLRDDFSVRNAVPASPR
jgi:hypothetical protein